MKRQKDGRMKANNMIGLGVTNGIFVPLTFEVRFGGVKTSDPAHSGMIGANESHDVSAE